MHWKLKACLQNLFAALPASASAEVYYLAQRHFGGLRRIRPQRRMRTAAATWDRIIRQGGNPVGKKFVEVGTGRVPIVPLAYWLMGAEGCLTIDINRYVRAELIRDCARYVIERTGEIEGTLGRYADGTRLEQFLRTDVKHLSTDVFLQLCNIDYVAPGNAATIDAPDEAFDFYTSSNVLEHVQPDMLRRILRESARVTSRSGLCVHRIDYSDHFSHQDTSISRINFLRYTDEEWTQYADNRYMYMNRLRHDDFLCLFSESGHEILDVEPSVEPDILELLKGGGVELASRFANKTSEVLATTGSWIVTRPATVP